MISFRPDPDPQHWLWRVCTLHAVFDPFHLNSMKCTLAMVYIHLNLFIFIKVKLRAGEFVCEYAGEVLGAEAARNRLQLQMQVDRISQDMLLQRLQFLRFIDWLIFTFFLFLYAVAVIGFFPSEKRVKLHHGAERNGGLRAFGENYYWSHRLAKYQNTCYLLHFPIYFKVSKQVFLPLALLFWDIYDISQIKGAQAWEFFARVFCTKWTHLGRLLRNWEKNLIFLSVGSWFW